ncbi:MAG: galactokinase family protein, partial [Leifsonia sp.]
MTDLSSRVLQRFEDLYKRRATGVWSAPGRVNLIGEHTDYNAGFVFPFAINRRTVLALAPREDRILRVASSFSPEPVSISIDDLSPEALDGWSAYPLGVAWALGQFGAPLGLLTGADILLDSEVPVGAGLSSSAAIESAMAVALKDIWHLDFDRRNLAKVGQLAENRVVGAPTG